MLSHDWKPISKEEAEKLKKSMGMHTLPLKCFDNYYFGTEHVPLIRYNTRNKHYFKNAEEI